MVGCYNEKKVAIIWRYRSFLLSLHPKTFKRAMKIRPNDPCPCGSGKKYKKCCKLIGDFEMSRIDNRTLGYMRTHDSAAILNMIIGMQI